MLNLPKECVIFDTEFTTWEGAMGRGWSGKNEYKEIVQIGAIIVDTDTLKEKDHLLLYVKPVKNPQLSEYFTNLTGITQKTVDDKSASLEVALESLNVFAGDRDFYSFGPDAEVIRDNCDLLGIPFLFGIIRFHDIRQTFNAFGVATDGFMSGNIVRAFGEEPKRAGHDGLCDARTILDGLCLLAQNFAKK